MRRKITVLLMMALLLVGCAASGQRAETLLAIEHATLSDQELVDHFQKLNGELAREKRLARQQGDRPRTADETRRAALWERWNEVRAEMGRRELLP
jgi:hypothetical protein